MRAARPSVSICIVASCARSVGRLSPRLWPRCSNRALLRCAAVAATAARQRPNATAAVPRLNSGSTTSIIAWKPAPSSVSCSSDGNLAVVQSHRRGGVGAQPQTVPGAGHRQPRRARRNEIERRIGGSRPVGRERRDDVALRVTGARHPRFLRRDAARPRRSGAPARPAPRNGCASRPR